MRNICTYLGALLLAWGVVISVPAQNLVGGYAASSVTDEQVKAAAAFAIQAQARSQTNQLELIQILSAEEQVVAGKNFRLKLKVKSNSAEKQAEAVVWWQAWRTPDPYQLTSWTWSVVDQGPATSPGLKGVQR